MISWPSPKPASTAPGGKCSCGAIEPDPSSSSATRPVGRLSRGGDLEENDNFQRRNQPLLSFSRLVLSTSTQFVHFQKAGISWAGFFYDINLFFEARIKQSQRKPRNGTNKKSTSCTTITKIIRNSCFSLSGSFENTYFSGRSKQSSF